jgi:hypothetical protein
MGVSRGMVAWGMMVAARAGLIEGKLSTEDIVVSL